jgi:hypothetical protein
VQVPLTGIGGPRQPVGVSVKSLLGVMLLRVSGEPLVLVRVTDCEALTPPLVAVNFRLLFEREKGAFAEPDPITVRPTASGVPLGALSVMISEPRLVPVDVGVTVTVNEQFLPAARERVEHVPGCTV